jgi:hypothetical protein
MENQLDLDRWRSLPLGNRLFELVYYPIDRSTTTVAKLFTSIFIFKISS